MCCAVPDVGHNASITWVSIHIYMLYIHPVPPTPLHPLTPLPITFATHKTSSPSKHQFLSSPPPSAPSLRPHRLQSPCHPNSNVFYTSIPPEISTPSYLYSPRTHPRTSPTAARSNMYPLSPLNKQSHSSRMVGGRLRWKWVAQSWRGREYPLDRGFWDRCWRHWGARWVESRFSTTVHLWRLGA